MKRGDIWTLQDDAYASKPRPVVIVQGKLDELDSVILCLLTSFERTPSPSRVSVEPNLTNGLMKVSYVMVDKILTVQKSQLGVRVGALTSDQMSEISRALAVVLEITQADFAER